MAIGGHHLLPSSVKLPPNYVYGTNAVEIGYSDFYCVDRYIIKQKGAECVICLFCMVLCGLKLCKISCQFIRFPKKENSKIFKSDADKI